ncbi:hypothetical protein I4U23_031192 [Adineta vaga]|nr:hypothetical protein I4U23_031192 [Adineta vaga]
MALWEYILSFWNQFSNGLNVLRNSAANLSCRSFVYPKLKASEKTFKEDLRDKIYCTDKCNIHDILQDESKIHWLRRELKIESHKAIDITERFHQNLKKFEKSLSIVDQIRIIDENFLQYLPAKGIWNTVRQSFEEARRNDSPELVIKAYSRQQDFTKCLNNHLAANSYHFLELYCTIQNCPILSRTQEYTEAFAGILTHPDLEKYVVRNITLYRGAVLPDENLLKSYEVGNTILTTTLISTSTDRSVSRMYCENDSDKSVSVLWIYNINSTHRRSALRIDALSQFPDELEVLLLRYIPFTITSTKQDDFDQIQNDLLEKSNPIFSKYLQNPYKINLWRIINESNRKYENNYSNTKYLVYSCPFMCGGWGDRTRKIVSTFLLSLVLNRTFIIDMTWPCSIEQFLTSNLISWSISSHIHIRNISSSINITSLTANDYHLLKSYHEQYSVLYIQTKSIAYFDLFSRYSIFSQLLFNQFRIKREHIQIIVLYPLFYDLLIKLKPRLQERFDQLNLNYSPKNENQDQGPLLCGHIRIGRNPSNPKDIVFPHREKMNITVLKFLLARPGRVFITTDSNEVLQLARKLFAKTILKESSRLIEINGTIAHIDRDWNYLACDSLEKTILDFHALSQCHLAVISKSSFGHLAIHRRIYPYEELYLYCNGIKRIKNQNDYNKFQYSTC